MSSEEKRQALKAKIEAAEQRNEERSLGDMAKDATDKATDFVKEHPFATLAGVAVVGLAIGAMTRPGRRAGQQVGRKASSLASYATELGLAYASGIMATAGNVAEAGKDKLEDFGDALNDNAGALRRQAAFKSGNAAAAARGFTREAGKKAGRSIRDLRNRAGK